MRSWLILYEHTIYKRPIPAEVGGGLIIHHGLIIRTSIGKIIQAMCSAVISGVPHSHASVCTHRVSLFLALSLTLLCHPPHLFLLPPSLLLQRHQMSCVCLDLTLDTYGTWKFTKMEKLAPFPNFLLQRSSTSVVLVNHNYYQTPL